ncbi:unnamed protein product [Closterium sp. NIES-65]|nr:unnamed protein product [Closterium sp. NIES-65]
MKIAARLCVVLLFSFSLISSKHTLPVLAEGPLASGSDESEPLEAPPEIPELAEIPEIPDDVPEGSEADSGNEESEAEAEEAAGSHVNELLRIGLPTSTSTIATDAENAGDTEAAGSAKDQIPAFLLALETRNRQLARHCGATRLFSEKRTTAAAAAAAAAAASAAASNGNKSGGGGGGGGGGGNENPSHPLPSNPPLPSPPIQHTPSIPSHPIHPSHPLPSNPPLPSPPIQPTSLIRFPLIHPSRTLLSPTHHSLWQLSERLVCLQHHLLLAGLLNRTLLVGRFHSKGVRGEHSWELAVDIGHLRMCYGEDTVLLAHEWRARERGKGGGGEGEEEGRRRMLVGQGDAGLAVREGEVEGGEGLTEEDEEEEERRSAGDVDGEGRREGEAETVQWRRLLKGKKKKKKKDKETKSKLSEDEENPSTEEGFDPEETAHPIVIDALVPWYKDKSVLPKRFRARPDLTFPRTALFANLTRRSPLRSFLSVYTAPEVRSARVLFVGDLLYAFWEVPDAPNLVNFPGDAPFVRSPGCPNPYTLLPNRKVLRLAKEIQKTFFSGSDGAKVPFIAVNYEKRAGLEGLLWCDLGGDADAAAARAAAADKESKSNIGFVKKGKRRGLRSIEDSTKTNTSSSSGSSSSSSGDGGGDGDGGYIKGVGNRACQLSVAEVAGCLWRKLSASGIRRLFLVTDASDQEVGHLVRDGV